MTRVITLNDHEGESVYVKIMQNPSSPVSSGIVSFEPGGDGIPEKEINKKMSQERAVLV
eukprot:CAMPEP_0184682546 /NCGR_PEP_ID=MMETSP0312-20130426/7676_1 /TAXON_ID=31354 /ORGANISM="Compsopogon coeruleus, Strain SAG 36.94" /LENGTH=58 /DNA_ID=CAMNT_0027134283 /DNA_START=575 /DNA_END=748 /DNA_ORIENTATION=+